MASNCKAVRNIDVGHPDAQDALKLSAFGVHANEFLTLQEFLPKVYYTTYPDKKLKVDWIQEKYGHPANWHQNSVEFCLKAFVNIAIRIQDAEWIPSAIEFSSVYEHKITALDDNVNIVQEKTIESKGGLTGLVAATEKVVVRTLKKGESIRGVITKRKDPYLGLIPSKIDLRFYDFISPEESIFGEIEIDKIKVVCVPRNHDLVKRYFPDLPELEYQ